MIKLALKAKVVFLKQIDWQDDRFLMSYGRPLGPLVKSIQEVGLRLAPILEEKEPGNFRIVTGRRRLRAVQRIGWESFTAEVLVQPLPGKKVLLFAFYENLGQRDFNCIELSIILKKLSPWVGKKDLIERYLPLLNLPPKKEIRDRYLGLTAVGQGYWPALLEGRLFPETVFRVREQFQAQTELLLSLMLTLRWGYQKQKEFLNQLHEIISGSQPDSEFFLESSPLQQILEESRMTPQQKGEALRRELRFRLYPTLLDLEKSFKEKKKQMALDSRTDLIPPPFFEGGRYRLVVDFYQGNELKKSLYTVTRSLEEGKIDDLP